MEKRGARSESLCTAEAVLGSSSQTEMCIRDSDKAARIALMIARLFKGYYVKCAVHNNTLHLHIHIIVGNTSYITGKQLDMAKTDLYRFCLLYTSTVQPFY